MADKCSWCQSTKVIARSGRGGKVACRDHLKEFSDWVEKRAREARESDEEKEDAGSGREK